MEFCPKCGSVLMQKRKNFACVRCGYSTKDKVELKTSEKIDEKKEVSVVKPKDSETLPVVEEKCKKCGNEKAYFWEQQTRASDESSTKFFKCVKCSHTWRNYD